MSTKICSKCGEEKEYEEFYRDKSKLYGRRNDCILCVKERKKTQHSKNIVKEYQKSEKYKIYQKEYMKTYNEQPRIKEYMKEYVSRDYVKKAKREYNKKYYSTERGREIAKINSVISYAKASAKGRYIVYGKVKAALKSGKLIKHPCFCGELKVEGHHEDYSKPLDVTWLCPLHHAERHIEINNDH